MVGGRLKGPIKSSPVAVDGVVYVGSNDQHIYAVDAETGTDLWKVETQGAVACSAAVVGGVVYMASKGGRMFALDAKSGVKKWIKQFSRQRPCGSPAVAYGVVFIGEGAKGGHEAGVMTAGTIVGLDAETGEVIWQGPSGSPIQSSPSVAGQTVYFGCWDGNVYAVNALTGELQWKYKPSKLPAPGRTVGGNEPSVRIISSPWPADGVIYVGCDDGCLYALH